jgi:hypothetical protein
LKPGGTLVFSTPCDEQRPHGMTGNHVHFKHHLLAKPLAMASSNGPT